MSTRFIVGVVIAVSLATAQAAYAFCPWFFCDPVWP
jgi:hypothetical protein